MAFQFISGSLWLCEQFFNFYLRFHLFLLLRNIFFEILSNVIPIIHLILYAVTYTYINGSLSFNFFLNYHLFLFSSCSLS